MASWRIIEGDCRDTLATLEAGSVQTCVTSPPYFGLRDYDTGTWEGGDPDCEHIKGELRRGVNLAKSVHSTRGGAIKAAQVGNVYFGRECERCGALRVDRQLGLEPTPDEFVAALVGVFREVRRVLRDDGTIWVNLGDSYGPEKQLLGIPWQFAFAMQSDGWVLRSDVVWQKPNPMPESVTDRPTKSHEFIFLFAKGRERAGRFAHISDEDARWLALFVDTEGCIAVKRTREVCGAQVSVAGTCRPLLERAQAIVGSGCILERAGQNAPMFYWQVSNKAARDLLLRLYPHLIVKKRQARICIHIESMTGRSGEPPSDRRTVVLDRLWEANKSCNSFGDPDISWVPEPNVFLLSKGPRYFFDADAIRESSDPDQAAHNLRYAKRYEGWDANSSHKVLERPETRGSKGLHERVPTDGHRNKRSVWTVATQPFPGAHFATFPPKLIEPCILAGCPERVCGVCGAPWERIVERDGGHPSTRGEQSWTKGSGTFQRDNRGGLSKLSGASRTVGWEPSCDHAAPAVPGTILDPFAGAGTTGMVALRHNRSFVGLELSPEYVELARDRIIGDSPLLNTSAEAA
jgi:DNA modification methylase